MTSNEAATKWRIRAASTLVIAAAGVLGVGALAACSVLGQPVVVEDTDDVVAAAGWTRVVTTEHYLVVVNVLPGEAMFTHSEQVQHHPTEGELILSGSGEALGPTSRHVEAHIYDRATGLATTDVVPTITLLNRTTGGRVEVEPTLMQDVNIGPLDRHFGNNVAVASDSDLEITVVIGDEEVTVDGHLD
ncbi:MAG: hypothetical protein RL238_822 [Actinomycetota bacterium]|jgi:hypothetical protein